MGYRPGAAGWVRTVKRAVGLATEEFGPAFAHPHNLLLMVNKWRPQLRAAILAYPDEQLDQKFPRKSPYDFYNWLRATIGGATSRIIYCDPYCSADTFHRYFRTLEPGVHLTIVTERSSSREAQEFLSVSRLFAIQYPDQYTLKFDDIHDRHLLVDDQGFHIGGSTKDAAKKDDITVTSVSAAIVEEIAAQATEVFGPSTKPHP